MTKAVARSVSIVVLIGSFITTAPLHAQQPVGSQSASQTLQNKDLAEAIIQLFGQDQALLADLGKAKQDSGFRKTFYAYVKQVEAETHNPNFYDPAVCDRWAASPNAPAIIRRYAAFRQATNARIRSIVAEHGWPHRAEVGDEAAAQFFFLFGHADNDNAWRLTQLPTIKRVFRQDHVNPRLYVHLCDRLANVAGQPQRYGSVMGPGSEPGTAKLYWPLLGSVAAADKRRAQLGLPSVETDLATFRQGATIGPYMTPIPKGTEWRLAQVYQAP